MKRFFWVLFVMSLWGHLLMAQEKAVSGIVVSTEDGLPMIGVAVVDKQTMNGVTTNEKGEFSMTVSPRTKHCISLTWDIRQRKSPFPAVA